MPHKSGRKSYPGRGTPAGRRHGKKAAKKIKVKRRKQ